MNKISDNQLYKGLPTEAKVILEQKGMTIRHTKNLLKSGYVWSDKSKALEFIVSPTEEQLVKLEELCEVG